MVINKNAHLSLGRIFLRTKIINLINKKIYKIKAEYNVELLYFNTSGISHLDITRHIVYLNISNFNLYRLLKSLNSNDFYSFVKDDNGKLIKIRPKK